MAVYSNPCPGWTSLLDTLDFRLSHLLSPYGLEVDLYSKEKFGTLRIETLYKGDAQDGGSSLHTTLSIAEALVDATEAESAHTCQTCGEWGKLRGVGWYYTACDKHTRSIDQAYPKFVDLLWAPVNKGKTEEQQLLHAILGLTGEVGEVSEVLKKHIFYGKMLDRTHLIEELGDVQFYYTKLLTLLQVDPYRVEWSNRRKLYERYKHEIDTTDDTEGQIPVHVDSKEGKGG